MNGKEFRRRIIQNKRMVIVGLIICMYNAWAGAQTGNNSRHDSILSFDFDGMQIGIAEYEEGPTGTTVFYFPEGAMGAADIRGGATGTVNAHVVSRGYEDKMVDAVVFSGGSWYGLSAATGVANEIKNLRAREGNVNFIAGVLGGIIYDVGVRRFSRVTPDDQLGREALLSAKPGWFPLGARGAGRFAMQGSYFFAGDGAKETQFASWPHSGQGAAFGQIGDVKIAVFTVVNSLGAVVDREGRLVRCHRNRPDGDCISINELISSSEPVKEMRDGTSGGHTTNTTLTLVVTNLKLPYWALERMAVQVHTSMGRAIQPFSTQYDGDVLYAVTTADVEDPEMDPMRLTVAASELAWDAVLSSVPRLPESPQEIQPGPGPEVLQACVGDYEFYGGGNLTVTLEGDSLKASFSGNGGVYFNEEKIYNLVPATSGLFIVDTPAGDVIKFNLSPDNIVNGLTINPGPWRIVATRN